MVGAMVGAIVGAIARPIYKSINNIKNTKLAVCVIINRSSD
jgi:hypothetical protein